jgi:hypothetical protein
LFEFSDRHDNDDSNDGVAQGVSSDLTGATGSTPEQTKIDPERPKRLQNPEVRNALHPVVTGSSFHRTRAAANNEEYPRSEYLWFHEFGVPIDNDATTYGIVRHIKNQSCLRERSAEVPVLDGAYSVK